MNIRPARLCPSIAGDIYIKSNDKDMVGDAVVGGNKKQRVGSREDCWMRLQKQGQIRQDRVDFAQWHQ